MHKNNFDFLRLLFSVFVLITHSYALSGLAENDWLSQITSGQTTLSYIGVRGFFIISGYLIYQSLFRSTSLINYYWKRILRLYPALVAALIITVLGCSFLYQGGLIDYFNNKSTLTYLPNNLSLYNLQFSITGIFENNPNKSTINGSLWTIQYEFSLYIGLSLLFFIRKKEAVIKTMLILIYIILLIGNVFFKEEWGKYGFILGANHLMNLGIYFISGSLLACFHFENFKLRNTILFVSFIVIILAIYFSVFNIFQFISLPFIVIGIGILSSEYINNIGNSIGDLSYGIYIYAFPVQQTLMFLYKFNTIYLLLTSFLIVIILSYLSWHLIEKRFLKLKFIDLNKNS